MIFEYNNQAFEYTITYSARKSIEIRIEPSGILKIKAPKGTKQEYINRILEKKGSWIENKVQLIIDRGKVTKRHFSTGEKIFYLGDEIDLTVHRHDINQVKINKLNGELVMTIPAKMHTEEIKVYLEQFYKQTLKSIIIERIPHFSNQLHHTPNKITIRNQKTRWGSCSSSGNLNFNYRLLMAPGEVIDYIIVHELCHLEHMNHSKAFWNLVEKMMPDYRLKEKWLKEHGQLLNLDWITHDQTN